MRAKVVWECPTCKYDLHGTVEGDRAKCPECGLVWTRRQLAELQGFFTWPDWRWAWGAPLALAPMVAGVMYGWPRLGIAGGGVWAWVCAWVMVSQMMRPRLGDMGAVFGAMVAVVPAVLWSGVCWRIADVIVRAFRL